MINIINSDTFRDEIVFGGPALRLVVFCSPSYSLHPLLEQVYNELSGVITMYRYFVGDYDFYLGGDDDFYLNEENADELIRPVMKLNHVHNFKFRHDTILPMFILYRGGQVLSEKVGYQTQQELVAWLSDQYYD